MGSVTALHYRRLHPPCFSLSHTRRNRPHYPASVAPIPLATRFHLAVHLIPPTAQIPQTRFRAWTCPCPRGVSVFSVCFGIKIKETGNTWFWSNCTGTPQKQPLLNHTHFLFPQRVLVCSTNSHFHPSIEPFTMVKIQTASSHCIRR